MLTLSQNLQIIIIMTRNKCFLAAVPENALSFESSVAIEAGATSATVNRNAPKFDLAKTKLGGKAVAPRLKK